MPEIGLNPNNADEAYIDQFDDLREGQRVTFLFDHGQEFHDQFEENEIECTVTDVDVTLTIANIEMEYSGHTFELRIRAMDSGRTMLDLKIDGQYGGTPMILSW